MTEDEQLERLDDLSTCMEIVTGFAERIAGHVLALERAGHDMPGMRETAFTLARIAAGWRGGQPTPT